MEAGDDDDDDDAAMCVFVDGGRVRVTSKFDKLSRKGKLIDCATGTAVDAVDDDDDDNVDDDNDDDDGGGAVRRLA